MDVSKEQVEIMPKLLQMGLPPIMGNAAHGLLWAQGDEDPRGTWNRRTASPVERLLSTDPGRDADEKYRDIKALQVDEDVKHKHALDLCLDYRCTDSRQFIDEV